MCVTLAFRTLALLPWLLLTCSNRSAADQRGHF